MGISSLRYAGHSAVLLEGSDSLGDFVVGIDPWLEGNPLCPLTLTTPAKLDLVVLSHGHSDHAGDAVRLAKECGCEIAATWELAQIMIREGVSPSKVHPMNKGGGFTWRSLTVHLTHALHSSSYDSKDGPLYAGEACGVVVRDDTRSIYHSGDTSLFSDMKLIGERFRPEIALICIGDRFTMGPDEAAIAAKMIGCRTAIPIHHSTFELLTGTPQDFERACAGSETEVRVVAPGERYQIQ